MCHVVDLGIFSCVPETNAYMHAVIKQLYVIHFDTRACIRNTPRMDIWGVLTSQRLSQWFTNFFAR